MKDPLTAPIRQQVAQWYVDYRQQVLLYIRCRINDAEEAEDLTQDVYLRLMDCAEMVRPETAKSFVMTIARNLVTDWIRRYYKRQEVTEWCMEAQADAKTNDVESRVVAADLLRLERQRMELLAPQRRRVYAMSRYGDCSVAEISASMNLSIRTVENHLRMGRQEIRNCLRACI